MTIFPHIAHYRILKPSEPHFRGSFLFLYGGLWSGYKKAASATEFDNKIAAVKEKIAKLEAKKKDVLTPKKRKPRKSKADQIKLLVRQAQKSGMKLDEIADKLGMALPE